jgi:Rrf2 family nitric oxide-sensitive transcriptional repressor
MKLTTYTDYTLRTLMYLAVNTGRPTTIADIANAYRISEAHLMKIVHQLGVAGDIETTRGRHGGIRLARSPEDINLGTVVRRTEVDMDLVPCFADMESCAISRACLLKGILDEALGMFLTVLDRCTLADLIAPRRGLSALLGVAATHRSPDPMP